MFLTARLFGVFTYIVLMLLALAGVRYLPQRRTKYVLGIYLIALCIVAWCYVPYITTDIYRLQKFAFEYAQMPLNDFMYLLANSKSGLFTLIYFRLFAQCLMPVTCGIVFGSMFYILLNTSAQQQVSRSVIMLSLFWLMTNDFYLVSITNIRSYVAVAFVAFCIYREVFQHKFGLFNILLYVCAIEMHSIGIVLVAFRTLIYLVFGGRITIWKLLLVPLIIATLIFSFPFYQNLLLDSTEKMEAYYAEGYYEYVWERVIFIIQTLVQGYILCKAYIYRLFTEEKFAPYKLLVTGAVIVLAICQIHVTFAQRWIIFSTILEIPVLVRLLQQEEEKNRHQIKQFLIASCLITFAFVCTRGNLCSLKFWE